MSESNLQRKAKIRNFNILRLKGARTILHLIPDSHQQSFLLALDEAERQVKQEYETLKAEYGKN